MFTVHTDTVFVNIIHIFFFWAVKVLFCFDFSYRILEGGLGDREGVMALFKFRYRTWFSFGGPLHFFAFDFVIGFWREGWRTGRATVGDRGAWSFFLGLILFLRIQYIPILYSSRSFTFFSFGCSRYFFAFDFSYRIFWGREGWGMEVINVCLISDIVLVFLSFIFLLDLRGMVGGQGRVFCICSFLSFSFPIGFRREGCGGRGGVKTFFSF